AMLLMRLEASEMRSSATACVLRWIDRPSLTSDSKALPPSSCALEKAPRPASQICCAESLMAPDRGDVDAEALDDALVFWTFLTMGFLCEANGLWMAGGAHEGPPAGRWDQCKWVGGGLCRGWQLKPGHTRVCAEWGGSAAGEECGIVFNRTFPKETFMHYFVTGATGFIGKLLVKKLLERKGAVVHFLIRKASECNVADLRSYWGVTAARAVPVFGDLTARKLGVSADASK